jgi:Flp pilus assembly protein TadB
MTARDGPSDSRRRYRRGLPDYHNPLKGVGGAAPAYSALTLRSWLAVAGLVSCVVFVLWLWMIEAPASFVVVLALLALVAVIDLLVIARRKRRGEPG